MNPDLRREMRDYAWKYFALHADQRIKTFNFFLIMCTLIIGGLITLLRDAQHVTAKAPCAIGIGLTFIAFIFWKLDHRNRELIRHAEDALKVIEKDES